MIDKANIKNTHEWERDIPRKRFSTPYTFGEKLSWIKNNLLGPSGKFKEETGFIPKEIEINAITPKITLGFIGDIMRMRGKKLHISPEIKEFFKPADYLIGNFEGTIFTGKHTRMAQVHTKDILPALADLFSPEKFVLSCANNHSGDYPWSVFNRSYQQLKDHGFLTIGRRDEPSILLDDRVNVGSCTAWSNQPNTNFIPFLDEIDKMEGIFNTLARFNILYPHWGYELQLYPHPAQIELAKHLLGRWGAIIGHHSHCPQPIMSYEIGPLMKVVAYSLGDFCFDVGMEKYHHGIITILEIGPTSTGNWQVGHLKWQFTHMHSLDKETIEIQIENPCGFFPQVK